MLARHAVLLTLPTDGNRSSWSYRYTGTLPRLISFVFHDGYENESSLFYSSSFFSDSCALFCIPQKLNPFLFKQFRTLLQKHPGVGVPSLCGNFVALASFLVISMMHLHSSEVVARCGLDFLCAGYFQWGLSRHMRVRFNAVVAKANSAATFPSPRIRNLRIPRCSFKIPMTGSASAFRRRYNARPVIEANLLRMRRRAA